MDLEPTLKLTDPVTNEPDVFPFERRQADRHSTNGRVTAVHREHTVEGPHNRICSLQMVDISDGGLGAIISEPVDAGSTLMVFFPAHGPERGFDLCGTVVRCQPREGKGWEVGLRFEQRAAA